MIGGAQITCPMTRLFTSAQSFFLHGDEKRLKGLDRPFFVFHVIFDGRQGICRLHVTVIGLRLTQHGTLLQDGEGVIQVADFSLMDARKSSKVPLPIRTIFFSGAAR